MGREGSRVVVERFTPPRPRVAGSVELASLPHTAVELVDRNGHMVSWEMFFDLGGDAEALLSDARAIVG